MASPSSDCGCGCAGTNPTCASPRARLERGAAGRAPAYRYDQAAPSGTAAQVSTQGALGGKTEGREVDVGGYIERGINRGAELAGDIFQQTQETERRRIDAERDLAVARANNRSREEIARMEQEYQRAVRDEQIAVQRLESSTRTSTSGTGAGARTQVTPPSWWDENKQSVMVAGGIAAAAIVVVVALRAMGPRARRRNPARKRRASRGRKRNKAQVKR